MPSPRFASAEIDENEHRALHVISTFLGMSPFKVAGIAIRKYLEEFNPGNDKELPNELKLYRLSIAAMKSSNSEIYLRNIACAYQADRADEELLDILLEAAELAGKTREEVMRMVDEEKLIPAITNPGAIDCAVEFLQRVMEPKTEYSAKDIKAKAHEEGITDGTLGSAKTRLGVRSERRPKEWVWIRD